MLEFVSTEDALRRLDDAMSSVLCGSDLDGLHAEVVLLKDISCRCENAVNGAFNG